jgi:hypothetical protein
MTKLRALLTRKKWKHIAAVLFSIGVGAAPAAAASPGFRHFVENHPAIAVYLPIAIAAFHALRREDPPRASRASAHRRARRRSPR